MGAYYLQREVYLGELARAEIEGRGACVADDQLLGKRREALHRAAA